MRGVTIGWALNLGLTLGLGLPLPGCAQAGTAASDAAAGPARSAAPSPAPALTRQWLALRPLQGRFDGAAWNDAVDRWQGAKHSLMQQLARYALQERLDADRLNALLGAPDQVLPAGAAGQALVLQQAQWQGVPAGDLWLYRWRGSHDQLVFALREGQVAAAGWWYAFE
jgi:hypothetical protein